MQGTLSSVRKLFGLAVLSLLVVRWPALGQAIELAEMERQALAGSPRIAEATARRDAALALVRGSGIAADPALELWIRNFAPGILNPGSELTQVEVLVVQPVRFPGKREAAESAAGAAAAVAQAELALAERSALAEVRVTFAELVAADREQRVLAEAHELQELLVATARVRFGAGQEQALGVFEAELALDRHDLELDRVYARFQTLRGRLATLCGLEPSALPLLVGELPEPDFPVIEGPLPVSPEAPELVVGALTAELAARRLELAERDLRPDFSLGGGFTWPEGKDPALILKAGMDLPFLRRRRLGPRVAAAEATLAAERAVLRKAELSAAASSVAWGAERDRLERALERLEEAVVPRASAAVDAARIAFLDDRVPFARLLELQNELFHARTELAIAEAERFAVWARWQEMAEVTSPEVKP